MKETKQFDLLILGGGPAGMTAAIYAARASLHAAIVESNICGGLVNSTNVVENFPSYKSIHGMELMQKVTEQVEALGVEVDQVADVTDVRLTYTPTEIETEEFIYQAPAVILSTGRKPVPLDIDTGECQQIHYCSICDGAAYKGKRVLIIGGGNSGFDEACYLNSLGVAEVHLVEEMDRFFAAETTQKKLLSCDNVIATTSTRVVELIGEDRLKAVRIENLCTGDTKIVDTDGIFVYMGQVPNTELFKDAITLNDEGYIIANEEMETNLAGVYAAGDVRQKKYRQITTAMSDGTIAALSAEAYIRRKI
jgi:thioredoxin reductase (NADPH)